MDWERMENKAEKLIGEASPVGKTLKDIFFYGDDPSFTKENMRAVYEMFVAPYETAAEKIREEDIPEDLTFSRGRISCGTKIALLYGDGTADVFFICGKLLSIEHVSAGRFVPPVKACNIDEHQLFAPVLGRTVDRYDAWSRTDDEEPELKIWFYFREGLALRLSGEGAFITEPLDCPISIPFRELLRMVRNHEDLFDNELVLREKDTPIAQVLLGKRQDDMSAETRLIRKLLEMNAGPWLTEAVMDCLETDEEREILLENADDRLCPRSPGDLLNEATGMKKARERGLKWTEGMIF